MDGEAQPIALLNGKEDRYGGVEVNLMEVEPMTAEDFNAKLDVSLKAWKDQGKKGIWIKLPCELSSLVDIAIKKGFTYHHAENEYAVLTSWISDLPSTIPANASHRIGIGALVLNKNREVLVVQEIDGVFKGTGLWKLPTGVIQEGEGIWAGAVREVKEETGIETRFVEVLAFGESHQSFLERKTDIYFLCELEPRTFEIKKQDSEILDAKWMPIEEYVKQPFIQNRENFRYMANICLKRSREEYLGFSTVLTKNLTGKESYLYCNTDHADFLNGKLDHASTSLFATLFRKCFCLT
ncbi:unnamed protein product [Arabidopsis halleri]